MRKIRYFITGAQGQVGSQLVRQLSGKTPLLATDRTTLDITHRAAVLRAVADFRPDVVVNAAAYTAVDRAESEPEQAHQINALGAENVAMAAQSVQAVMLHLSTDYVFDGMGKSPYREDDAVSPQNIYGRSKWAGECAVQASCSRAIILRTAWVFNESGHNFVNTMLRLGASRSDLGVVADQWGAPTYAGDIAAALIQMAERVVCESSDLYGVYHFSGSPFVSWYEFAEAIFAQALSQGILSSVPVLNAITTADYPTPAVRPAYSCLNNEKIQAVFGIVPSDWQKALRHLQAYSSSKEGL